MKRKQKQNGFTLIETIIAIAIIALGITGLMFAMAAGTSVNEYSGKLSDAAYLADQVGVIVDGTRFDDLADLDGVTFNAVDSSGQPIEGMSNFSQVMSARPVNPIDMSVDNSADPQAYLITVSVMRSGEQMTAAQWLKVKNY